MDELIVYLIRTLGWTYEYAASFVRKTSLRRLNAFITELKYQEAVAKYETATNFAMLLANWASAQGKRRYRVTDFIGQPPRRPEQHDEIKSAAELAGIIMPKEGK